MDKNKILDGQLNIFDFDKPTFKIDKPIRLIETFAGYGSQAMALERIGADFEHYKTSEWEINAVKSYKAVHMPNDNTDYSKDIKSEDLPKILCDLGISNDGKNPMGLAQIQRKGEKWQREVYNTFKATNNLGSVMNFKGKDLGIVDTDKYDYIMSYSFPCFIGESLVLTDNGYKQIKDIKSGEKVLTHTNEYKTVLSSKCTGQKEVYKLRAMAFDKIECTENHKFYVRKKYRKYPYLENGKRASIRLFTKPEWKECKDLTKDDYLGIAINQNSIIPQWDGIVIKWKTRNRKDYKNELSKLMPNPNFWWIVGRFIGDGWVRSQGGITICAPFDETDDVVSHIEKCGLKYTVVPDRTTNKINMYQRELEHFFADYGKGAINKHLPGYVFDMPVNLLESLLDGYMSADGYIKGKIYKATSISKELIYGLGHLVAKVYNRPFSIILTKRNPSVVIEGRTCQQHDTYTLTWKNQKDKQDKAFYENGYIWFPIKELTKTEIIEKVYDIEVKDSNSFTVNNCIVHNCTNLSLAGKQAGMKKGSNTSSSLLWEIERLLNELKEEGRELPQILLMENVPQVISTKNKPDFDQWIAFLESLGYTNAYQVMNAKDYGVAQNRKRCFMISILGNYQYEFPNPIPLKKKLKDYLEDNVDKSYYITNEKATKLIETLLENGTLPKYEEKKEVEKINIDGTINHPNKRNVANCITARYDNGISNLRSMGNLVVDKEPVLLKGMVSKKYEPSATKQDAASTLMARDYKGINNFGTNGVIESIVYDDYNHNVKSNQEVVGTVMPNFKNNALGNGTKIIEVGNLNPKETRFTNPQTGRVYSGEGLSPTLNTCGGGQREPKVVVKDEGTICLNPKGGRNGTKGLQPSTQDRVYSPEGCMTAVTTSFMPSILEKKDGFIIDDTQAFEDEPRIYDEYSPSLRASRSGLKTIEEIGINKIDIAQTVRVRKYPVDTETLCNLLRLQKERCDLSNKEIAEELCVPITKVEHWFRRDNSFAIPDEDIWPKLKALLKIETDEFDQSILTFEERDGVYEKSERHYLTDGLAPTLTSASAGNEKFITPVMEKTECIVAMRGRNPENSSDRTVGAPTEQRLEPNSQGICNTLTTVQKDNLVLEEIQVVVDKKPQTVRVKQATKQGYIECEIGGVADLSYPTSTKRRGRVQGDGHICPTLTTSPDGICRIEEASAIRYQIRKLTERECGRLMGVIDEDITKMQAVNSKSQLYKQYGNSIVVNCLVALFSQLGIGNIPRWNDGLYKKLEEEKKL